MPQFHVLLVPVCPADYSPGAFFQFLSSILAAAIKQYGLVLQACSDAVRFLDERKAGMVALLDRSVRDATLQQKVS